MPEAVAFRIEDYGPRPHRSLEERVMLGLPWVDRALARAVFGLSPRSRVRRTFLTRIVPSGWSALNRRDLDLLLRRFYSPDVVAEWTEDFVALGMPPRMEGHAGYRDGWLDFWEAWADVLMTPRAIVDLGERLVQLARGVARGAASGAEVDWDIGLVMDLRDGRVARERFLADHAEALRLAGVDPDVLPRIEALPPGGVLELSGRALTRPA